MRLLGAVCGLVLSWLVARRSADALGVYRTLISFLLIADFASMLGMQSYLIREVSLHPDRIKKLGYHALVFSLLVAVLGIAGLGGIALLSTGYTKVIRDGLLIAAISLPATGASLVGTSTLVGLGKTTSASLIQGSETVLRTGVGIVLILRGYGILAVVAGIVVIRCVVPIGYWCAVKPELTGGPCALDGGFFRAFIGQVPTFVGIAILAMVLRFSAPLSLPWILNNAAAGQFAAAYIFVDMLMMIPTALTVNLVPVLVRRARVSGAALIDSCRLGIKIMATGVMPVAAILAAVAHPMFANIFPGKTSYAVSADVLEVVIWTCCLQSIDQLVAAVMLAKDKQHIDLQTLIIGSVGMIILLSILIPLFGVIGAAFGVLGGVTMLVVARFILLARHVGSLQPTGLVWRPAVASIVAMGVAMFASRFHWIAGAVAGAVVYVVTLGLLGALTQAERASMLSLLAAGKA